MNDDTKLIQDLFKTLGAQADFVFTMLEKEAPELTKRLRARRAVFVATGK